MKKFKNLYLIIFSLITISYGCQDDNYSFGEIITPSNIQLNAEIVGADLANPNGDGSGVVNFTVSAENASSYVFYFDGIPEVALSGKLTKRFSKVGLNLYNVSVKANGKGGISSSKTMQVEVFSSFSDLEAENLLSGVNNGDFKKWYWQADKPLHVGLGPVEPANAEDGNFAFEAWWSGIQPWDTEKGCMYDNEFVFTRTANGITFEQTVGPAFVPGTYAGVLNVAGDTCHDETVATNMFGVKRVSFAPSESTAGTRGTYNGSPYRGTNFTISEGGFMGWFVGASTYDIISVSDTELIVRIIQEGNGFAWYHRFTSTKPIQ